MQQQIHTYGRRVLSDPNRRAAYARFLTKLRQARRDAKLTQVQVAEMLGTRQTFVSKAELGERRLDIVEVQILAHLYGKHLTYFQDDALM